MIKLVNFHNLRSATHNNLVVDF